LVRGGGGIAAIAPNCGAVTRAGRRARSALSHATSTSSLSIRRKTAKRENARALMRSGHFETTRIAQLQHALERAADSTTPRARFGKVL